MTSALDSFEQDVVLTRAESEKLFIVSQLLNGPFDAVITKYRVKDATAEDGTLCIAIAFQDLATMELPGCGRDWYKCDPPWVIGRADVIQFKWDWTYHAVEAMKAGDAITITLAGVKRG